MKQTVRLKESELRKMITESIKKILNEMENQQGQYFDYQYYLITGPTVSGVERGETIMVRGYLIDGHNRNDLLKNNVTCKAADVNIVYPNNKLFNLKNATIIVGNNTTMIEEDDDINGQHRTFYLTFSNGYR